MARIDILRSEQIERTAASHVRDQLCAVQGDRMAHVPVLTAVRRVWFVSGQDDVDDLLSSLGF